MFATQRGLDVHITKTKGRSCELLVRMAKRKKEIAERNLRNSQLSRVKFKSLGSMGRVPIQRRKSGKRLTKENKEDIIKNYNYFRGDNNSKGMAVKKTADAFGSSPTTVRKVLKEIMIKGKFTEGKSPRNSKSTWESLTIPQRDLIRKKVHDEISKCRNKEEGAIYPTNESLHKVIQTIPGLPKWSKTTTSKILRHLGFAWLKDHQVNSGLLSEDPYTNIRRGEVCKKLLQLEEEGAYIGFLDESFINLNYRPKKIIQDTTIHTNAQAVAQDVTPGINRKPGKGERLLLIGVGSVEGWLKNDVIKRKKGSSNYKDDMNGEKFEEFVEDAFIRMNEQYPDRKKALVVDNASYHTKLSEEVPTMEWKKERLKQFCFDNVVPVPPKYSARAKNGHLVKKDFYEAARKHVDAKGEKYRLEALAKKYNVEIVRLPPYHPELNPIELI